MPTLLLSAIYEALQEHPNHFQSITLHSIELRGGEHNNWITLAYEACEYSITQAINGDIRIYLLNGEFNNERITPNDPELINTIIKAIQNMQQTLNQLTTHERRKYTAKPSTPKVLKKQP